MTLTVASTSNARVNDELGRICGEPIMVYSRHYLGIRMEQLLCILDLTFLCSQIRLGVPTTAQRINFIRGHKCLS